MAHLLLLISFLVRGFKPFGWKIKGSNIGFGMVVITTKGYKEWANPSLEGDDDLINYMLWWVAPFRLPWLDDEGSVMFGVFVGSW